MSSAGIQAAKKIREGLPEEALTLAAELRNAITPAALAASELEAVSLVETNSYAESIRDTVHHIATLANVLQSTLLKEDGQ